jgi:hypothetical protein
MARLGPIVHRDDGRTEITAYVGTTEAVTITVETVRFHKLTPADIDDMVQAAVTVDRPPVRRRRRT